MINYIFIVPYRDREQHKTHFLKYMEYILEEYDKSTYEIIIVHQKDNRPFNRGAIKNIGFLYAREKYDYYKEINFIFNDVDTIPSDKNLLDYNTKKGIIKHYYGFNFCLGGIFSVKGEDFEKMNGFPSYWTWGFEDNVIAYRAEDNNIKIDRSVFFPFGDMNIIQSVDGLTRIRNNKTPTINLLKNEKNGIRDIKNYKYNFNKETNMLDVECFDCGIEIPNKVVKIDITKKAPVIKKRPTMMFF